MPNPFDPEIEAALTYGCIAELFNGAENPKDVFHSRIDKTFDKLQNVQFFNKSYGKFLDLIRDKNAEESFIYCDPPYINSAEDHYKCFTEADSLDLFNCLHETGCKYAMSEFDHSFILQQAKERNLNVVYLGERQNLKNRRTEILVMNYNQVPTLFQ